MSELDYPLAKDKAILGSTKPLSTRINLQLKPENGSRLRNLVGQMDEHINLIETRLKVLIQQRGQHFVVEGSAQSAELATRVIEHLWQQTESHDLNSSDVHLTLEEAKHSKTSQSAVIKTKRVAIKARSKNQAMYIEAIDKHDIVFGIGPAGTGKTFIAVCAAVSAYEAGEVERILLVRPAVEAGERLGFLPGDLSQKVDPYLRPLYDALYELMGIEQVHRLLERQVIEVAPLAYMRGRTLNDAYIILDESQNTTPMQMKMFLTRIGFGSTAIITGDITQVDLPAGTRSGLKEAKDILLDVDGIAFCYFDKTDVVRHPLVQSVIDAYERKEKKDKRND